MVFQDEIILQAKRLINYAAKSLPPNCRPPKQENANGLSETLIMKQFLVHHIALPVQGTNALPVQGTNQVIDFIRPSSLLSP